MSDYTQTIDFSAKDSLLSGDPAKLIKGADFDTELASLATAINSKFDTDNIASQAEAEGESSNTTVITPLRLANWSDYNAGMVGDIQALADPGADRVLFWDDSAGAAALLAPDGTTIAISGTTLSTGSNVPLLDAANTFTSAIQKVTAGDASWRVRNTGGGSDAKVGDFISTGGTLAIRAINDAENAVLQQPLTYTYAGGQTAIAGTTIVLNGVNVTDYARLSQNNTFSAANHFAGGGISLGSAADQGTLLFSGVAGAESGDQFYVDFGAGSSSQGRIFGYDSSAATFRHALNFNVATGAMTISDSAGSLFSTADIARLSQNNTFSTRQIISSTESWTAASGLRIENSNATAGNHTYFTATNNSDADWKVLITQPGAGTPTTTLGPSVPIPVVFSGASSWTFSGKVLASTISNSTSTTLVAGQLHFVAGDCTLPNLTAGQWIQIVNDDSSPHTISVNGSDTTFWTTTGATISTSFTLAARGVLTARCNPAGTAVYVSGSGITGAS